MLTVCSNPPQTTHPLAITHGLQAKRKESLPQGLQSDVFLSFLLPELDRACLRGGGLVVIDRLAERRVLTMQMAFMSTYHVTKTTLRIWHSLLHFILKTVILNL